jgi:hypothetical protein
MLIPSSFCKLLVKFLGSYNFVVRPNLSSVMFLRYFVSGLGGLLMT